MTELTKNKIALCYRLSLILNQLVHPLWEDCLHTISTHQQYKNLPTKIWEFLYNKSKILSYSPGISAFGEVEWLKSDSNITKEHLKDLNIFWNILREFDMHIKIKQIFLKYDNEDSFYEVVDLITALGGLQYSSKLKNK